MTEDVSTDFRTISSGGYAVHADPGLPAALISRLLADPAFPLTEPTTRVVKNGDTTRVVRTDWMLNGQLVPVAYKRVRRLTWIKRLTQAIGTNRTWRTYRAGERLEDLGIPTARPLLILLPDRWRWRLPTWIANEWLDDASHLGRWVREYGRTEDEWRLDEAARLLGNNLGRLHRAGGTHRDIKPENVMARLAGDDEPACVWLIDLDGLRFRRWIGARRRWRDLSRLAVGIDEAGGVRSALRLRFLRAYLDALGDGGDWKRCWRSLWRATERRAARRARRKK